MPAPGVPPLPLTWCESLPQLPCCHPSPAQGERCGAGCTMHSLLRHNRVSQCDLHHAWCCYKPRAGTVQTADSLNGLSAQACQSCGPQ
jgi:hypothetical protein